MDRRAGQVGWPIAFIIRPVFVFAISGVFILLRRSREISLADDIDDTLAFQFSGMRIVMANREHTEKS
jgi:hypothetical protein